MLEQYHAAYTFRILNKAPFNILETLSPEDYKDIRKLIISCILSTDMKEHFDEVKNLKLLTEGLKQMEGGADLPHLSKTSSKKLVKFGDQPQETENKNIGECLCLYDALIIVQFRMVGGRYQAYHWVHRPCS